MENNTSVYAECNGDFIDFFLKGIGASDLRVDTSDLSQIPNNRAGLYMFYLTPFPGSNDKYPIYVGYTTRSFQQRFTEHATYGVINDLTTGRFPLNFRDMGLRAYLVPLSGYTAKFMESILLGAYDFCLNREENGNVRPELNTYPKFTVEQSKHYFENLFRSSVKEVNEIYTSYAGHLMRN